MIQIYLISTSVIVFLIALLVLQHYKISIFISYDSNDVGII